LNFVRNESNIKLACLLPNDDTKSLKVIFFEKHVFMTIAEKVTNSIHCKKPNGLTAIAWGNAPKKTPQRGKSKQITNNK
jgi:hypothetical protein